MCFNLRFEMPLSNKKGSIPSISSIPPAKSPYCSRKKRTNKIRTNIIKEIPSNLLPPMDCGKEASHDSTLRTKTFEQGVPPEVPEKKFPSYPVRDNENLKESGKNNLKRSSSFPSTLSKEPDLFNSTTDSSLFTNTPMVNIGESVMPCSSRTLDSESVDVTSGIQSVKLSKNSDSAECISTFSQGSHNSTIRDRNFSVDSAFSQISLSDATEIDLKSEVPHSDLKRTAHHSRSRSDASSDPLNFEYVEHSDVFSLPSSFSEHGPPRKSIFGGKQMVAPTECFFPRPRQGQTLTSFLTSNEFNISAELDRENAHFCISEALIAAIEHMKCTRVMKALEEEEESDEEIRKLTQRIRIRRKEKLKEKKCMKSLVLLSDGRTDTTTSQSASPPLSSHSSEFDVDSIGSEDQFEDIELSAHADSSLSSMKETGLSLSMASLYSDADLHKALQFKENDIWLQDSESNNLSAESVALSLIRKFKEKHLPKASELQWIVTEQEAPQQLLPLPNSWPISPDVIEEELNLQKTRLRGNLDWAPPRPQIIFTLLPYMKKKDILEKQKYRCAGCGMKIEKNYVSRFRYCSYFGKYFCQCCHSNSLAYIPGRILWSWDFKKYYVSKFAWGLLDCMFSDPLFNIQDINKNLYQRVRLLENCRCLRLQMFHLKSFIKTCRNAEAIQEMLSKENHHYVSEPHLYSLCDLLLVKKGELSKHFRTIVNPCLEHVKQCMLCQAKGFICEVCDNEKNIIFPFQLDKVMLCDVCGSCYHKTCMKKMKCPKCKRIEERKKRLREEISEED